MNETTIEERVADTILEAPIDEFKVGGKTYVIAAPSIATLILVSKWVSKIPDIKLNPNAVLEESLKYAKDYEVIGDIVATLVVGAKCINDTIKVAETQEKPRLWGLFTHKTTKYKEVRKVDLIKEELLEEMSPRELHNLFARALNKMQLADFFSITTFLSEVNLTKPTKVETTEATASGQ